MWIKRDHAFLSIIPEDLAVGGPVSPILFYDPAGRLELDAEIVDERACAWGIHEVIQMCRFVQENPCSVAPVLKRTPVRGTSPFSGIYRFRERGHVEEFVAECDPAIP